MLSEIKLNLVKQFTSDFSRDELIWASGYLAGLSNASNLPVLSNVSESNLSLENVVKKITLAYGTETGNSKKLATELAGIIKKQGIQVKLTDLSQYKTKDLVKENFFFVIISTQGEGEPPSLAKNFFNYIFENEINLLDFKFGILALGDSSYPLFCKTGEDLDSRFEILGGDRFIPLKKCDVDYQKDAHIWVEHIIEAIHKTTENTNQSNSESKTSYIRKKYVGKVSTIINLNDITSEKETYHIEIETDETLVYNPGDALGVIPINSKLIVDEIINLTKVDPEKEIETPKVKASIKELLTKHLNISYLLKNTVEKYAQITGHPTTKTRLSLLDLIKKYPVNNTKEFEQFIPILTGQAPRLYSISSSIEAHGDSEIHITVAKSQFITNEEKKNGLCSGFLSDFKENDELEFYIQEARHFKLPKPDNDIIMIGPGTGIAPFRSFLWERDATGSNGRNWLFFGDRNFNSDFLYQAEIIELMKTDTLTNLDLAFSRDTDQKIYVQDKLKQKGEEVFQWLESGASVYVCGAKEPMSKDVEETLLAIIQNQGHHSKEESILYLEEMELNGRYAKDVY